MSLNKRARILAPAAAVLALSAVLSACGGGGSASPPAGSATGTGGNAAQTPAPSDKPAELKAEKLNLYFAGDPQKDTAMIEQKVNEYIQPKINATVKINWVPWGDYNTKMPVLIASGENIDVMMLNRPLFTSLVPQNALNPVNDLFDKYGPDAKKSQYDQFLQATKVNGKNYAVLNPKEFAQQWVVRFNMPLVKQLGLDISNVKSIADLEPLMKQAKAKDSTLYPMLPDKTGLWYVPFDYVISDQVPFGVAYDKPSDNNVKIVDMWETLQAKQMLDLARKYYQEGFIRPDVATYKLPASEEQAGKWLTSLSQTIPGADLIWTNRAGFEVKSNPIEKPVITSASAIGSMLAIPVSAKDPARSMMLINLLHKDAYLHNLFVYGVEGTHYQKISDQVIQALPARKEGWNPSWFEFGNNFLNYLEKGDPDNKWDLFKQFNESAVPSPLVGFQFDPAPVQAEIAAVTNVSAAIFQPLVTGSVDPDKFLPEAIGKLKAAGSDKIIAEMQKQYDAWKAKK